MRLNENELLGKDVKVLLRNDIYGNPDNEPKLKGNSVHYFKDKTVIKKANDTGIAMVMTGVRHFKH